MKPLSILLVSLLLHGCLDTFEKDISRRRVTVVAPVDGARTAPGSVTFLWDALPDAENYRLTLVTPSFEAASRVVADTLVSGLKFTLDLAQGAYQWALTPRNFAYAGLRSVYTLHIGEPASEPEPEPDDPMPAPEPEPEPESPDPPAPQPQPEPTPEPSPDPGGAETGEANTPDKPGDNAPSPDNECDATPNARNLPAQTTPRNALPVLRFPRP